MITLESCVGNTPLVDLTRLTRSCPGTRILVKLEGNNPAGSVKDRAALSMFEGAEVRGVLQPNTKIIEPTSGNTGIALAMIAARKGYGITLVMPENMTVERRSIMTAFGARLELTSAAGSMEGAIDRAREMVQAGEGIMFDQFSNQDNWMAHYRGTGPEIWFQTNGQITHFVSSMGTTGTIMGVSRALKERQPLIQIIGVQPDADSRIPGIRRWPKAYLPKIFESHRVDLIMDVNQEEAREVTLRLAREEGIFVGHSSGGAVTAALRLAKELTQPGMIVVVLPDRGDRYLSSTLFA